MMSADLEARQGPLTIGQVFLERFTILRQIGRGGYAFVYEAEHRFMRHHVAIKVLHRDGGVSEEMVARGQMEAQVQQRIKHEHVAEVHDAGVTNEGKVYIIMELLNGRPCRVPMLELGRIEVEEALRWAIQLGGGLHAAHELGVIHRDVKPDNCFVTAGNHLKLLDFGIAKAVSLGAWATQQNMMLGTPHYMSPEQVMGGRLTHSTDIYSLAVMLYEALAGFQPVSAALGGVFTDVMTLARTIAYEPFRPLNELDPHIPRYVADLIGTACAKKVESRFQTAEAFSRAAAECLARYTADARRSGLQLQTRDLSLAPVRSDVIVKEAGSKPGARDTEQVVAPPTATVTDEHWQPVLAARRFEAAAASSGPPAALKGAPPVSSERPTVWARPNSEQAASPIVYQAPQRPPASTPARPSAKPASPRIVEHIQPLPQTPAARPEPKQRQLGKLLIPVALLGFFSVGAAALYLTRPVARASNDASAPPVPSAVPDRPAVPPPPDPSPAAPALPPIAAPTTPPSPAPDASESTPLPSVRPPIPPASTAPSRPAPAASLRPAPAPPRAGSATPPAPSKSDVDKMEQRLQRVEKNLDGNHRKLIFD